MKRYQGTREGFAAEVRVNGQLLNPRLDLWNHSPTGFEWGYGGSGPSQLALALLADHLRNDEEAVGLHQEFKRTVVAGLPHQGWLLTSLQIGKVVETLRAQSTISERTRTEVAANKRSESPRETAKPDGGGGL